MAMPFLKAVTTDNGVNLLNRAQNGEGAIAFTRMAIGNGLYGKDEKVEERLKRMTALKSLKNSYNISATGKEGDNSVKVTAIISNQDLITKEAVITEGYNINEIGLFARIMGDEDDILFSIAVTSGESGDYMPAFTGSETAQIIQNYIVSISSDLSINLKYSDAAVAFKEDVDRQLDEFKLEVSAEQDKLNKALDKAIKDIADSKGANKTVFNADGSITSENSLVTITTVFNKDRSITKTYKYKNGITKKLKTVFKGREIITTEE